MGFLDSIGDLVGNAGSIVGDMVTGGGYSQLQSNRENIQLARESRDWSERMSNSAYQRAVTDMRAAGLNPMLAYQQGGASTPSPTTANVVAPKLGAGLASSAKSAIELMSSQDNVKADTTLKQKSADKTETESALNAQLAQKAQANAKESEANTALSNVQAANVAAATPGVNARAARDVMDTEVRKIQQPNEKTLAPADPFLDRISKGLGAVNSAVSIVNPFKGIFGKTTEEKKRDAFKDFKSGYSDWNTKQRGEPLQ